MSAEGLERAARPGRTRGIGVELWERALADRLRAGPTLSRGLREARALHSAERRTVQEVLYGLIRTERGLVALVGDDPLDVWLGRLVLSGLDPRVAAEERPGPWEGLRERFDVLPTALRHSVPDALAARIEAQLGLEEADRFWVASGRRAPMVLRAHLRRAGTRDRLASRLREEGIETTPVGARGLRVEGRANVEGSRAYRDGWFEVQDEGSQRLVDLVGDGPGTLLDLCAGAGGKSLALADRGHRVVAADVRPRALAELEQRAKRGGVRIETVALPEDHVPTALARRRFDVVLVDAPCTGTGVLRRNPADRWRWSPGRTSELAALQGTLLERGASLVAPGGRLVYATCSVDRAEDEDVVQAFVDAHPAWEAAETLRTWPQRDGTDGFYGCVLTASTSRSRSSSEL
ncbi:MAG: RsmB/NOP family class I SAM-dependent RNA methyltransferase [Myxococcales bacterium]|nr:RsmB/NOP family class I SAM-dependent RNA methyltransferase [Myxococcales bacterium]